MIDLTSELRQCLGTAAADKLLVNKKDFITLQTQDEPTTLLNSKIGGRGYLPLTMAYPVNDAGQPLALLAQINFAEMPRLAPFPSHGILAFYVDYFDDFAGMSREHGNQQTGFRVHYFADTSAPAYPAHVLDVLFASAHPDDFLEIVTREQRLVGELATSVPFAESLEFEAATHESFYTFGDRYSDTVLGELMNQLSFGNNLGGYPAFTQGDPRPATTPYDTVLFQLDSDTKNVLWGDSGIGNFFINSERLQAGDFSDVLYTWDSY